MRIDDFIYYCYCKSSFESYLRLLRSLSCCLLYFDFFKVKFPVWIYQRIKEIN